MSPAYVPAIMTGIDIGTFVGRNGTHVRHRVRRTRSHTGLRTIQFTLLFVGRRHATKGRHGGLYSRRISLAGAPKGTFFESFSGDVVTAPNPTNVNCTIGAGIDFHCNKNNHMISESATQSVFNLSLLPHFFPFARYKQTYNASQSVHPLHKRGPWRPRPHPRYLPQ
jgi:hypothetical protein